MATALITEAEAKAHLKLAEDAPTTPQLTLAVSAATRHAESLLGRPILPRSSTYQIAPPRSADQTIVIGAIGLTSASLAGDVAPSQITQLDGYTSALVAPNAGWPDKVLTPPDGLATISLEIAQEVLDGDLDDAFKWAGLVLLFAYYYDPSGQESQGSYNAAAVQLRPHRTIQTL